MSNIPEEFETNPIAPFNDPEIQYPEVVESEVIEDEDALYRTDSDGEEFEI